MAENAYTRLPKSQQWAAGAVLAVVAGVGFNYGWYADKVVERDKLVKDLTALNAQVAELNVV